jgi:hypothetical protein
MLVCDAMYDFVLLYALQKNLVIYDGQFSSRII